MASSSGSFSEAERLAFAAVNEGGAGPSFDLANNSLGQGNRSRNLSFEAIGAIGAASRSRGTSFSDLGSQQLAGLSRSREPSFDLPPNTDVADMRQRRMSSVGSISMLDDDNWLG